MIAQTDLGPGYNAIVLPLVFFFLPAVSLSDNALYVSYILFATIPILLLLLVATGVFCYKRAAKR